MSKKIFILDDDVAVTELLARTLSKNGLEVQTSNDLDEATANLSNNKYDLIISDIILGEGVTCDELILELSDNEEHPNFTTEIVMISRFLSDEQSAGLITNIPNVVQVFKKPFDRKVFANEITSLVNAADKESFTGFDFEDLVTTLTKEVLESSPSTESQSEINENTSEESSTEAPPKNEFKFELEALQDIDERNKLGQTWIMQLSALRDMENVKKIIYRGGNLKLKCKAGKTALHYASRSDNPELVEYLMDRGLKHTMVDIKGEDPLYDAIKYKRAENARVLIEYGARIERQVNGSTYLIHTVLNNDIETFKVLLSAGADPRRTDQNGSDAIAIATKQEKVEMLKILKAFLAKKK